MDAHTNHWPKVAHLDPGASMHARKTQRQSHLLLLGHNSSLHARKSSGIVDRCVVTFLEQMNNVGLKTNIMRKRALTRFIKVFITLRTFCQDLIGEILAR